MQTREEWLKERKTYIGGSDIGAIIDESKWKTSLDVYLDKISDEIDCGDASEAARWGNILEPVVADEYSRQTGFNIELAPNLIRHTRYPHLAANIDRWADDKKHILECKTARFISKEWGEQYTDTIPVTYLCQVAWYASICDVPKVDIAVLFGGQEFRIYTYMRNIEFEDKLIRIADNFWSNNVLKRIPPE